VTEARKSPVLRAKLAVTSARIGASERQADALVAVGSVLGRAARRLLLRVHADERIPLPQPLVVAGTSFDVLDDLQAYTGLPDPVVAGLVQRRLDSFRAEWFLAPEELRADDWYYRATSAYLFGNAVHLHGADALVRLIEQEQPTSRRALDFGGGTGNLALALAALGWSVDHLERSALQKDFTRFRLTRYALEGRVTVLDDWEPLERDAYDLICAIDVLEHVHDLNGVVLDRLLPALRRDGTFVEASPFHRTLSNPMHHEHTHLDELLGSAGLTLAEVRDGYRVWRQPSTTP
jgi:SAM-dependent methyltransferase